MMAIPIHNQITGDIWISDYDLGIIQGLGAVPDTTPVVRYEGTGIDRCFKVTIAGSGGENDQVPVYFQDPEAPYRHKTYPCIVIDREDHSPALNRWMSIGQLEYRAPQGSPIVIGGVSGHTQHMSKIQAMPYDIVYTITAYGRYERSTQAMLKKILQTYPPVGKLFVKDSLGLQRSYELYHEGGIAPRHEVVDPAIRFRGYAVTVRIEGELDLVASVNYGAVTGVDLNLYRMNP